MASTLHRLVFLGLALLLWQCETPIAFPADVRNPELGVISEFSSDRTLEVKVFEGDYLLGEQPARYLEDATVSIYRDDIFLEQLVLDRAQDPPVYVTQQLLPLPGVTYRIEVEAEGYEGVAATSRVPASIPIGRVDISSFEIDESKGADQRHVSYRVRVAFSDPEGESNFYHLQFFQEIWHLSDADGDEMPKAPELRRVAFHPLDNGNQYVAFSEGGLLFGDEGFAGRDFDQGFTLRFDLKASEDLGQLMVELRTVSKEYYLFQTSLAKQSSNPGQPIDDGVTLYNNIVNGRGIFAGYSTFRTAVDIVH